jgi:hypothetical protein
MSIRSSTLSRLLSIIVISFILTPLGFEPYGLTIILPGILLLIIAYLCLGTDANVKLVHMIVPLIVLISLFFICILAMFFLFGNLHNPQDAQRNTIAYWLTMGCFLPLAMGTYSAFIVGWRLHRFYRLLAIGSAFVGWIGSSTHIFLAAYLDGLNNNYDVTGSTAQSVLVFACVGFIVGLPMTLIGSFIGHAIHPYPK